MRTESATASATPTVSVRTISVAPQARSRESLLPAVEPTALVAFSRQLQELVSLEDGWDSYGAAAPDRTALEVAWRLASELSELGPAPQVFPTRRGGVQLEWHQPTTELEWEIDPGGVRGVFVFDNHVSGEVLDGELPDRFPELRRALEQVLADR